MDPTELSVDFKLGDLVEQDSFEDAIDSFRRLFVIPIRIFDKESNLLVESYHANKVCSYISTIKRAESRCMVFRSKAKATNPTTATSITDLDCFCGLRYSIAAIMFQGKPVGKMLLGPYLPAELERIPDEARELEPDIKLTQLRDKIGHVRSASINQIHRLLDTMRSVIDVLLFSAHKTQVTAQMHLASVRESYRTITEKNRKLEELNEERKEFDRRKSNFLAMVSHELRTPLTSIIGYSDMLTEGIAGELADEQKQFIETIKTKGDELLKLISSILDFSQMDSGHLNLQIFPTDISQIIERVVEKYEHNAHRRGVRLSLELSKELPEKTDIDPDKITTALEHMLDNAIKFSPPDGVVKVVAKVVKSSKQDGAEDGVGFVIMAAPDMLEISIRDFGTGIDDKDQSKIFSPFTQIDSSSTREHGGAGLGLAIVKQYVEAHGGRVIVKSNLGEGSTFTIRLPLA